MWRSEPGNEAFHVNHISTDDLELYVLSNDSSYLANEIKDSVFATQIEDHVRVCQECARPRCSLPGTFLEPVAGRSYEQLVWPDYQVYFGRRCIPKGSEF